MTEDPLGELTPISPTVAWGLIQADVKAVRRLLESWVDEQGNRHPGKLELDDIRFSALERDVAALKASTVWWKLTLTDLAKIAAAALLAFWFGHSGPRGS